MRRRPSAALLVSGLGAALLVAAIGHHAVEVTALDGTVGPAVALLLDGLPALALVYAGFRLSGTDLAPADRRRVAARCWTVAALFGVVMSLTFLVRSLEGRPVGEPVFPLLVAVEAGGLAGVLAGYYESRARADARRAETVNEALAFVNDLIRHDLRNDLTAVRGHADLVGADDADLDSATVIAEKADEALTRLETTDAVVETLVDEPDLEPLDLVTVVAETVARVESAYPVDVTTDLPDRALVTANAGLRSVVDNLLENAAEHNDADDPWLGVSAAVDEETVRLSVADNGPGIPDERKRTVFDADGRADRGGLVIVDTLVDGYGGEVWVEDREGEARGSVFVAELPRAA